MATSRTGTGKWKNLRARVIHDAKRRGIMNCPECGILLDFTAAGHRNSVEVDHIVPYAKGGRDEFSNCRAICRRCNQSLGARGSQRHELTPGKQYAPREPRGWLPAAAEW